MVPVARAQSANSEDTSTYLLGVLNGIGAVAHIASHIDAEVACTPRKSVSLATDIGGRILVIFPMVLR